MNKRDLRDGMMLKLRNNNIYSLLHGNLLELKVNNNYKIIASMHDYNDKFENCNINLDDPSILDVMNIYDKDLELLWERKGVNWDKVPFGTKVACWNDINNKFEGRFLGYNDGTNVYAVFVSVDRVTDWKYCELVEEVKIYEDELAQKLDDDCEDKRKSCGSTDCKVCSARFILENYNVTRK